MPQSKTIGVLEEDDTSWHIRVVNGYGGYDTLCGIDGNDPSIGTFGVLSGNNNKITCIQCYSLWKGLKEMKLRESDFNPGLP